MLPLTTMLVFGPYRQNRFGKFGIVMPRYARGSPFHCVLQIDAAADLSPASATGSGSRENRCRRSTRRRRIACRPVVLTPVSLISAILSVTSFTLSRRSARIQLPLSNRMRLPPGGYCGVTFVEQLFVVAAQLCENHREHLAQFVVLRADRAFLVVPRGIFLHGRENAFGHPPEHREAIPLRVVRHVVQQPVFSLGNVLVVLRRHADPRRRALENHHFLRYLRHLGRELERARAGADHEHALAGRGRARAPTRSSGTRCL